LPYQTNFLQSLGRTFGRPRYPSFLPIYPFMITKVATSELTAIQKTPIAIEFVAMAAVKAITCT